MKSSPETSSLAAAAYETVRGRIARGHVGLGQVISRRKIAVELGMSFLPVSMALLRLESEGLLESRPRAGTRVRIPSPEDVRGQYVVREALEVHAARLFVEAATPAERADLQKLAARVDALSQRAADRPRFVLWHQKLHRRIAECTRCPALAATIEQTNVLAAMWFCVARQLSGHEPKRRHQDLLEILCHGTRDEAAGAMREHIEAGLHHTLDVLKPYFRMRKAAGTTFYRRDRKQIAELLDFKIAGDVE
jgi:DNA-binding GntR family transcriptional regulator